MSEPLANRIGQEAGSMALLLQDHGWTDEELQKLGLTEELVDVLRALHRRLSQSVDNEPSN